MEPIIQYFESVRRSALVIQPKQPFFEWLKSIDPSDESQSLEFHSDVYLLKDFEEVTQMENWLKKNFDKIFSDQLNNWYVDKSLWVKSRTFKMFSEWFSYSLHTMVWDTESKIIEKS
jgi:hypothetical protein